MDYEVIKSLYDDISIELYWFPEKNQSSNFNNSIEPNPIVSSDSLSSDLQNSFAISGDEQKMCSLEQGWGSCGL